MRSRSIVAALAAIVIATSLSAEVVKENIVSGREPLAGALIPYPSQEEALAGGREASAYLQPLTEWTESGSGNDTEYTAQFKKPFAWADRLVMLHVDGAAGGYDIYVNDRRVAWTRSGATPSDFDLTAYSVEGNNTVKIVVLGADSTRVLENRQGRGTYRSAVSTELFDGAYIYSPPKARVRDFVVGTNVVPAGGIMELGLILKSALLNTREVKLSYELFDPEGELVGQGSRDAAIDMRREDTIRFLVTVPEPKLWSHETPYLYTVVVKNLYDGRYTEYLSFKTAFVDVGRAEGKLTVNTVPLDMVAVSYEPSADKAAVAEELRALRSKGVNTLSVASGPQSGWFYDMCDSIGMYVCVGADIDTHLSGGSMQLGGNPSNDPSWAAHYEDRIAGAYYTSRNHPCAVMFALADDSANGICLYDGYLGLKRVETDRPVVYLGAGGEWNSDAVSDASQGLTGYDGQPRVLFVLSDPAALSAKDAASVEAVDAANGRFAVVNLMQFRPFTPAVVRYTVTSGKRKISSGTVNVDVSPGERAEFTIPLKKAKPGVPLDFKITVGAAERTSTHDFTATR